MIESILTNQIGDFRDYTMTEIKGNSRVEPACSGLNALS